METENQTQEIALSGQPKTNMALSNRGVVLTSFDELWRFSVAISKSGMAPKDMQKPESIMIAIQMGLELGLTAMASLQNIAVINGRPTIWGDAAKALVLSSPICEYVKEYYEGDGETLIAWCVSKRKGGEEHKTSFSMKEAKAAGLTGKQGPWTTYPKRMLMMRSRGFELRDNFTDVLKGFITYEEVSDYEDLGNTPKFSVEAKVDKITSATNKAMEQMKTTKTVKPETVYVTTSEIKPEEAISIIGNSANTSIKQQSSSSLVEQYTEAYLRDLTLDNIKGVCQEMGIDFVAFEGKNTNTKLRTLILEKQMGMPYTINLIPQVEEVEVETDHVQIVQEVPPADGKKSNIQELSMEIARIGEIDASGKRSFSDMRALFSLLDAHGFGNDRILFGIKATGLPYANKELLCKSGTHTEIIKVISNC